MLYRTPEVTAAIAREYTDRMQRDWGRAASRPRLRSVRTLLATAAAPRRAGRRRAAHA